MVELVRMIRPDGHTADVHPDEVENYRRGDFDIAHRVSVPGVTVHTTTANAEFSTGPNAPLPADTGGLKAAHEPEKIVPLKRKRGRPKAATP